ncbi:FAD-dependent oxidoreductase [Microbacterium sp. 2C]|uniref:NAD(P)/FAD-dependent oxidoreductase n=1 Tax=Microbacterium paulum TaxID=2707006 RepID=UPI0018C25C04|nr:FAD-dependent oxidoreductase [Microbacterium paulum]MBG0717356.1 FAD-dependent oxidoreductase [Microbacterium paulum]
MTSAHPAPTAGAAPTPIAYDHVIVGGGMVADAAARGIRERDTADDTGAVVVLRTRVTALRPDAHELDTDAGDTYRYGTVLIATGGTPVALPIEGGGASDRVLTFRTAGDYRHLRALAAQADRIAVVGGGYIGSELAAALVQQGVDTVLVHSTATLGADVFPADLADHFAGMFRDAGVELVGGHEVVGGVAGDAGVRLDLEGGATVVADAVVSGLGIEVQTELAESSGIATGDGIVVDAHLRTDRADVFAAGDVAEYPDRILGRRRVEHVDNAEQMGRQAGRNLAGAGEEYTHTPYYYSVVFGTRYEAVGTLDGSLETVDDWVEPLERGVVYYLDDDRVVGVLLWNIDDRTDAARAVLTEDGPVDRDALIDRIREEAS